MSLQELMRAMAEEHHAEPTETLTEVQQVARLRDVFEATGEVFEFEPGDIVQHKFPHMATMKGADVPFIFNGYLDEVLDLSKSHCPEPSDYYSNALAAAFDARVSAISEGKIFTWLVNSQHFRPHPDFERDAA